MSTRKRKRAIENPEPPGNDATGFIVPLLPAPAVSESDLEPILWLTKKPLPVKLALYSRKWDSRIPAKELVVRYSPRIELYRDRHGEKVMVMNKTWASKWAGFYGRRVPHHRERVNLDEL